MSGPRASGPVETVAAVKGASRGFSVLLVGGVVQPWVGHLVPPLGYVWLALVALAAFLVAAWPFGEAPVPSVATAVLAAAGSYALVLPLVLSAAGGVPVVQLVCTGALAVVVGATTAGVARVVRRPRATAAA